MINAPDYTFFGTGHGISRSGQADSECGASIQGQANRLRGAGVVHHRFDNAQSCGTSQGHARVAG